MCLDLSLQTVIGIPMAVWGEPHVLIQQPELGKAEQELFLAHVVEADAGFCVQAAAFHREHRALAETLVSDADTGLNGGRRGGGHRT